MDILLARARTSFVSIPQGNLWLSWVRKESSFVNHMSAYSAPLLERKRADAQLCLSCPMAFCHLSAVRGSFGYRKEVAGE